MGDYFIYVLLVKIKKIKSIDFKKVLFFFWNLSMIFIIMYINKFYIDNLIS